MRPPDGPALAPAVAAAVAAAEAPARGAVWGLVHAARMAGAPRAASPVAPARASSIRRVSPLFSLMSPSPSALLRGHDVGPLARSRWSPVVAESAPALDPCSGCRA